MQRLPGTHSLVQHVVMRQFSDEELILLSNALQAQIQGQPLTEREVSHSSEWLTAFGYNGVKRAHWRVAGASLPTGRNR